LVATLRASLPQILGPALFRSFDVLAIVCELDVFNSGERRAENLT